MNKRLRLENSWKDELSSYGIEISEVSSEILEKIEESYAEAYDSQDEPYFNGSELGQEVTNYLLDRSDDRSLLEPNRSSNANYLVGDGFFVDSNLSLQYNLTGDIAG